MEKDFYTPKGVVRKALTQTEVEEFAAMGDGECRRHLLKEPYAKAVLTGTRVKLLAQYLRVIEQNGGV